MSRHGRKWPSGEYGWKALSADAEEGGAPAGECGFPEDRARFDRRPPAARCRRARPAGGCLWLQTAAWARPRQPCLQAARRSGAQGLHRQRRRGQCRPRTGPTGRGRSGSGHWDRSVRPGALAGRRAGRLVPPCPPQAHHLLPHVQRTASSVSGPPPQASTGWASPARRARFWLALSEAACQSSIWAGAIWRVVSKPKSTLSLDCGPQ